MDPSEEKKQDSTPPKEKSKLIPLLLVALLLSTIAGIGFYFYSGSNPAPSSPTDSDNLTTKNTSPSEGGAIIDKGIPQETTSDIVITDNPGIKPINTDHISPLTETEIIQETHSADIQHQEANAEAIIPAPEVTAVPGAAPAKVTEQQAFKEISICDNPALQLNKFYKHLDSQAYMAEYRISAPSKKHFTALIQKLLDNPPQVSRESDDLYTILKNTAHFFRVSGKDNILMMKGILDKEKSSIEQILADYYLLVTTPKCSLTVYASDIDHDALYEYACFFLNTMGGRLYLFRRDSLSRMVVTYYAILLVDQANIQNNNRHGIALKPVVDMLIAEMEAGGSSLKQSESYLDKLYDLKEKYQ